ncbi:hypothetical protein [Marinospirillum perlucidum]|uniref:hypothetical protein n=1 Tax=Marinospirillum perlucidum TaxID=1982602 RepID=UPI000DF2DC50|nr:hypothetical protein [Marinospirillum perlucidum]
MQIYLVGGAVRDRLLGLPVKDKDWVVVGSTPDEMLAQGFKPVGRDFPVFLHPQTHEEYALARTERKQGRGYKGFEICADPTVTLEEDLLRRDLTLNAIAEDSQGQLIDPFDGQADITAKRLRAVSPAFAEDPLRVLRTARFAARFAHLGFEVETQTLGLMKQLVSEGEMAWLTPERVWLEMQKALACPRPGIFFELLNQVGALQALWPEVAVYWQQRPDLSATLQAAAEQGFTPEAILAMAFARMPAKDLQSFIQRLPLPRSCQQLLQLINRAWGHSGLQEREPEALLQLLETLDAWRQPEQASLCLRIFGFLEATRQEALLQRLLSQCRRVSARHLVEQGLRGPQVGEALRQERLQLIAEEI